MRIFFWACQFLAGFLLADAVPAQRPAPLAPTAALSPLVLPLTFVEVVTGGEATDARLPLIVALHGRGDTAEDFAALFRGLPFQARVAILRAPHPWGSGQAWFLKGRALPGNAPRIAAELLSLSDRVVATVAAIEAAHATRDKPLLMGFSQGAMLTWAIAVRHPETFSSVFPVAGFLFPEILARQPFDAAKLPAIVAFHGSADRLVPTSEDQRGVRELVKRGAHAELRTYEGVPHAFTPAIRNDLFEAMARATKSASAGPRGAN